MRRQCRERFPRHLLQKKHLVNDSDMHHGTCVTHVSWCMSGSLNRDGGESVPGVCATRKFTYLAKGPEVTHWTYYSLVDVHKCKDSEGSCSQEALLSIQFNSCSSKEQRKYLIVKFLAFPLTWFNRDIWQSPSYLAYILYLIKRPFSFAASSAWVGSEILHWTDSDPIWATGNKVLSSISMLHSNHVKICLLKCPRD